MDITVVDNFRESHRINTKGSLAAVLQLNRFFSTDTLPINPDDYRTEKEGQVKGLSKDNCQKYWKNITSVDYSRQKVDVPAEAACRLCAITLNLSIR